MDAESFTREVIDMPYPDHGIACNCPNCMCERDFMMKIDRPHEPWGPHVDVITPLGSDIPGVQKLRIGPTGSILSEDFNIKKKWP